MKKMNQIILDIYVNQEVENDIQALIKYGKVEELQYFMRELTNSTEVEYAKLAPSMLRSMKNTFIAGTAIAARTSIAGGVNYDVAIALSDDYIAEVEQMQNPQQVGRLLETMLIDYTSRVQLTLHPETDSATVKAIYRDIQAHLYEKVSSKDIAGRLSMERTYLCHHFKDKTGMTITEYVRQQKIREAEYLLTTSDLPISIISERLGFSSQQQFQTVFKEVAGETPGQYRSNK